MVRTLLAASFLWAPLAPAFAQDEAPLDDSPLVEVAVEAPPDTVDVLAPTEFDADNRVTFDEPRNDVFGMGEEVRVLARVGDNALLMGREIEIAAPVDGDVFGMGETVRISSLVMGDVYAMAGDVIVTDGAVVRGNIYALGGEVEIDGDVGHDVSAGAGSVRISGAIGGDVDLAVGELVLEEGASIAGNLSYEAPAEIQDADDVVEGEVSFTLAEEDDIDIHIEDWDPDPEPQQSLLARAAWWSTWRVFAYGSTVLLGLAVFWLGGASATSVGHTLRDKPGQSLGIGFATLMLLPPVALMCILMVVPGLIGATGFLAWSTLLLLARVFVAHALGDLILRQWRPDAVGNPIVSMAVGLVPMIIVFGIPWLGWMAHVAVASFGMGAVIYAAYTALQTTEA